MMEMYMRWILIVLFSNLRVDSQTEEGITRRDVFVSRTEKNSNQTLYVGIYDEGYKRPWSMLGMTSRDGGRTFSAGEGPFVCADATLLYNLAHGCPDGSAVDDGKGGVHMVFDWNTNLGPTSKVRHLRIRKRLCAIHFPCLGQRFGLPAL